MFLEKYLDDSFIKHYLDLVKKSRGFSVKKYNIGGSGVEKRGGNSKLWKVLEKVE